MIVAAWIVVVILAFLVFVGCALCGYRFAAWRARATRSSAYGLSSDEDQS